MAARRPQPRLLNEVMDAIANLKEPKGSTMRRILNQMETNYVFNKKPVRLTGQPIMKALRHGVEMGLIRRNKGKFKLGLEPKDYAVYKTFQKKLKARELCSNSRNRRKNRRPNRRRDSRSGRKRRRRLLSGEEPSDDEKLPSSRESISTNPEDKAKRKKRKRSRKRSRKSKKGGKKGKGRRRSSYTSETTEDSTKDHSPKSSRHSSRSESDHEENDEQRKESENPPEAERQYHPNCGNPECLCNVNQEEHMDEDN